MKRKYLLLVTGAALLLLLVFLAVFLFKPKEYRVHPVNLDTAGKSELVKRIKIIQQSGARPRFSPDGKLIVFDRKNEDGFYDLYLGDLEGNIVRSLTEGNSQINQRNNGNGVFHPAGKYIVFISEEENHAFKFAKWAGDPGLGSFANLYATTPEGERFWPLTNIPLKESVFDKTPVIATVNPHFTKDGAKLYWTERYKEKGGSFLRFSWGKWQIKMVDFVIEDETPRLENERIILRAEDICPKCNYVTAMEFLSAGKELILAGNLSGQPEYGMDQYVYNLETKKLTNLTNTPEIWEEDSSLSPQGRFVIYMSNQDSNFKFNFANPNWAAQPVEREYYLLDTQSLSKKRLTYFNEPTAPEYLGKRVLVAASDFSPDGRYLAGILGVDFGQEKKRADVELKIVIIEFKKPLR